MVWMSLKNIWIVLQLKQKWRIPQERWVIFSLLSKSHLYLTIFQITFSACWLIRPVFFKLQLLGRMRICLMSNFSPIFFSLVLNCFNLGYSNWLQIIFQILTCTFFTLLHIFGRKSVSRGQDSFLLSEDGGVNVVNTIHKMKLLFIVFKIKMKSLYFYTNFS